MSFTPMTDVPNPLFDLNGDPFSGAVLKAYLPGTTTAISIYTDAAGSSPQATLTANAQGAWEVTGSEVVPYIDQDHKWGIFANASDAASNTPFYMGPFDNVEQMVVSLDIMATVEASENIAIIFTNYADLVSGTLPDGSSITLTAGQNAEILYRVTEGDGGANAYLIGTFGTANGFTIVDLDSGLQAKGLFRDGRYRIEQAGASESSSNNSPAVQTVIDEGIKEIWAGAGDFQFTETLNFYLPVTFRGAGSGLKWAGDYSNTLKGLTKFIFMGTSTDDAVVVGGRDGSVELGGGAVAENINVNGIVFCTEIQGEWGNGILLDGSFDTYSTGNGDPINRGFVRNVNFHDCMSLGFGGRGWYLYGNVFACSFWEIGARGCDNTGFDSNGDATNTIGGKTNPGQIMVYQPIFIGQTSSVSAEVRGTYIFGGNIQGGSSGVRMDFSSGIFGTHIEGDGSPSTGDGVKILGRNVQLYPQSIASWETGVRIGTSGDATNVGNYSGTIPLLTNNTVGIEITDGGARRGSLGVANLDGNGTDFVNDRYTVDGTAEFFDSAHINTQHLGLVGTLAKSITYSGGETITQTDPTNDRATILASANGGGSVSLSVVEAIEDGLYTGQELKIMFDGAGDLTVPDAANTKLGGADIVLNNEDVLVLIFDGAQWRRMSHEAN